MQNENVQLSVFVCGVLASIKEQRRSAKEVKEEYMRLHPPGFFRRQLSFLVSEYKIEAALRELVAIGFVSKEITRFHRDRTLRKDIVVYHVTNNGRLYLLPRKK